MCDNVSLLAESAGGFAARSAQAESAVGQLGWAIAVAAALNRGSDPDPDPVRSRGRKNRASAANARTPTATPPAINAFRRAGAARRARVAGRAAAGAGAG